MSRLMRRDFILPILLAVALVAMTLYARTGAEHEQVIETTPILCSADGAPSSLRELPEASGLAISRTNRQLFWSHNDSGEPYLVAIGADGTVRGRVRVAGAEVNDWEAVTTAACGGGNCLYVGDIGDNERARRSIVVYRIPEPRDGSNATEPVTAIEATYPDGPQDAEALFVADGHLYVVTKGEGTPVRLYRFPSVDATGTQRLELVAALTEAAPDKTFRITDAAVSPDERWVALRSTDQVLFFDRVLLLSGKPGTPQAFDLRGLREPQGEGLAWSDTRTLFLAGEGKGAGTFARISCNLPD